VKTRSTTEEFDQSRAINSESSETHDVEERGPVYRVAGQDGGVCASAWDGLADVVRTLNGVQALATVPAASPGS
jgi:hypothetical protein